MTDLNPTDELPTAETPDAPDPSRFDPWRKLRENPKSRSQAIKTMCFSCMGWGEGQARPAGIIADIRGCTSPGCPLFAFRPYRDGETSEDPNEEPTEQAES